MGVIEMVVDFPTSENIQSRLLRFGIWTPKKKGSNTEPQEV